MRDPEAPPGSGGDSSDLLVQEIGSVEAFLAFEDEWRSLFERAPVRGLFQTWEWLAPRLEAYWKGSDLVILLVRRKGLLVGAAPLLLDRRGSGWCAGSLVVVGEDLLCDGPSAPVLDAVLRHLRRSRHRWRLGLTPSPHTSDVAASLPGAAARHGVRAFVRAGLPSQIVRFDGSWEQYLATRSAHVRREWKRKEKKLLAAGRVEVRAISAPSECESALDAVMAIEAASWKQTNHSSIASHAPDSSFHRELARRCAARGWLRLHVLHLDGRPIAHFYGVRLDDRLYGLKTTYDVAFGQLSPGVVVVQHALRAACAEGVSAVDLLGNEGRWKGEVANDTLSRQRACAFTRSRLGCEACFLLRGRIRPFVERRAPALAMVARDARRWLRSRGART